MKTPMAVTIDMAKAPEAIRESIRSTLVAHGRPLPERVLIELGRNAAHALYAIEVPEGE